MSKHDISRVEDMLDSARKAVNFTEGYKLEDLNEDEVMALALVRLLEIIGEAARFVPESIKSNYPDVPWSEIAATRNRLIHGYFSVDLAIVWTIIRRDLPPLIDQLETITKEI